jgi:NAD+ diphosphatase
VFLSIVTPAPHHLDGRRWCITRGTDVLVQIDGAAGAGASPHLLTDECLAALDASPEGAHFLGEADGVPIWAVGVDTGSDAPSGYEFAHLRTIAPRVGEHGWMLGARAVQVVEWARAHRFCGACGTATSPVSGERAMACPACGLMAYPRLSPAVIMVVRRGHDLLLAHGKVSPRVFYGPLAGFVEPGETLEEAVRREVREEVGVTIGGVTYFGSQPWPFPNSFMIGFFADYEDGEIVIDPREINDARWFTPDELPDFGEHTFTISARLVEAHKAHVLGRR